MQEKKDEAPSNGTGLSKEMAKAFVQFEKITQGEVSAIKTFLMRLIFLLFQNDIKALKSLESSLGEMKENALEQLTDEERLQMEKDPSFFEGLDNVNQDLREVLRQCIANLENK